MRSTPYQIKQDGKVYYRGTLAQLMAGQDILVGEPTADDLPSTINPLQFLCNNLIVNNGFIVKIKQDAIQVGNNYIKLLSDLQYVVPPEKAVLLCIELSPVVSDFTVASGNEDTIICDALSDEEVFDINLIDEVAIAYNRDECDV